MQTTSPFRPPVPNWLILRPACKNNLTKQSVVAHGERVGRAYFRYTEPPSDLYWTMGAKQLIWETNESRASTLQEDPGAGSCNLLRQYAWNQHCITTGALRTIANNNEARYCLSFFLSMTISSSAFRFVFLAACLSS